MPATVEHNIVLPIVAPPGDEAEINLVFVHGIGDSWEKTWCASDHSTPLWLVSLLPNEFPAARIFTYGYDVMTATHLSPGQDFCRYLVQLGAKDKSNLPIIFIGHSLGGLIIQDALLLSRNEADSSSLLDRMIGIIFLGTPFFTEEIDWATFGNSLMQITKTAQLPDSTKLAQLRRASVDFRSLLKTKAGSNLSIWCFFESLPTYRMGILVPQSSAIIDPNQSSPLQSDHFGLSKSDGPWDSQYQAICATLRRMCHNDREISPNPGRERNESADNREIVIGAIKNEGSIMNLKFALVLEDQGHSTDAAMHYEKIIENQKTTNKHETHIIMFCKDKLASIYRETGSYAKAENLYNVLEQELSSWSNNDVLTLQSAANLALFLRDQGSYNRALLIIQDKLASETRNCYRSISQVKLVGILAIIFMDLHDAQLSLYLSRSVLSACAGLLGPHDPFTLDQASNLAVVLIELGDYRFAEMIDRRVLDTLEKNLGSNHPRCLKITNRLANNLRVQKDYERAVTLFTRTLKVQETHLGSLHRETLSAKCGLAATYALQDRYSDSKILLLQVNNQYTKILSSDHPNRLWTTEGLKCLEKINNSNRRGPGLLSDMPDKGDCDQIVKKHFGLLSLRVVAKTNRDAEYGSGLVKSAMPSLIGNLLHKACFDGNEKKIEELLMQSNVDINAQAGLFGTSLCVASFKGHTSIVKRLLNAGANPDTNGISNTPALRVALMMNRMDIAWSLLEKKANPNIMDRWYGTPLHEAAMAGQSDTVNLLLKFSAKPNLRGGLFGFPLLASAWMGDVKSVEFLLREGAFLDAQEEGKTAFYLAQVQGHDEIVKMLYQNAAGRDINTVTQSNAGAAPQRIDDVLRPDNAVEIHEATTFLSDSGYHPNSETPRKTQKMERGSPRTNGHATSWRRFDKKPKTTSDHAQGRSVMSGDDRSQLSTRKKMMAFLKKRINLFVQFNVQSIAKPLTLS